MTSTNNHPDKLLALVDHRLSELLDSSDRLVARFVSEIGKSRGKLLRPQLMIACSRAFGGGYAAAIANCAACCELLHTATLIHDDVIDEADKRRGMPTLNSRFGNELAVVVGDYLLAMVFRALNEERDHKILDMILHTSQELGFGVIEEVLNRNNFELTQDKYYEVIYFKSAALFSLCCRLGAYLGGADPFKVTLAGRYGKQLGLAFQVVDDLLDVTADVAATGKPTMNDLREGRITLPAIHALNLEPEATQKLILEFQQHDESGIEQQFKAHLNRLGSISFAYDAARHLLSEARVVSGELMDGVKNPGIDADLLAIEDRVINAIPVPERETVS